MNKNDYSGIMFAISLLVLCIILSMVDYYSGGMVFGNMENW